MRSIGLSFAEPTGKRDTKGFLRYCLAKKKMRPFYFTAHRKRLEAYFGGLGLIYAFNVVLVVGSGNRNAVKSSVYGGEYVK